MRWRAKSERRRAGERERDDDETNDGSLPLSSSRRHQDEHEHTCTSSGHPNNPPCRHSTLAPLYLALLDLIALAINTGLGTLSTSPRRTSRALKATQALSPPTSSWLRRAPRGRRPRLGLSSSSASFSCASRPCRPTMASVRPSPAFPRRRGAHRRLVTTPARSQGVPLHPRRRLQRRPGQPQPLYAQGAALLPLDPRPHRPHRRYAPPRPPYSTHTLPSSTY